MEADIEQEWATLHATMNLNMIGFRVRRCLHFCLRWPTRGCLLGCDDAAVRVRAVQELKQAYDDYRAIQAMGGDIAQEFKHCSLFELPSVKQYVQAFDASGWTCTPEIRDFACRQARMILQTHSVEEQVHYSKAAADSAPSKRISDVRCWAAPVQAEILSKIHRYEHVQHDDLVMPRGADLPADVFYLGASCPKELLEVAGPEEKHLGSALGLPICIGPWWTLRSVATCSSAIEQLCTTELGWCA